MPSQPVNMNTAPRNPAATLPRPPTPDRLSQPRVSATVPGWRASTAARPAAAKPIRIAYSAGAIPTCIRAVILMPATAITSITRPSAVAIAMFARTLPEFEPNTASAEGPSTSTPLTVAMMYAAIISHPVKNPRYGLMARPTHSKLAPQLAFHMFSRR